MEYYRQTNRIAPEYHCHFHNVYEIYYFISGDADYMVEGQEYHLTPHSLLLLAPNVLHGVRINSDATYARYCLYVAPSDISTERCSLLLSTLPSSSRQAGQVIFYEHVEAYGLEKTFRNLMELQKFPKEKQDALRPVFNETLLAQIQLLQEVVNPSHSMHTTPSRISDIIRYINLHPTENITLDSLSEQFYLSKFYMNRAFKKTMGTTIIDYVLQRRVLLGKQHLLNGETATRAAELAGFQDYSSFYRAYRKVFGTSPRSDQHTTETAATPQENSSSDSSGQVSQ